MAFQFLFESVLQLRRSQERQQQLLLQRKNSALIELERRIVAMDDEVRRIGSEPPQARSGAELSFDRERLELLIASRAEAQKLLDSARDEQRLAAEELQHAWRKREALDVLRRRAHEEYARSEARLEQRRQDDRFLQRRMSGNFVREAARQNLPVGKNSPASAARQDSADL